MFPYNQPKYELVILTKKGKRIVATPDIMGDVSIEAKGDWLSQFSVTLSNAVFYIAELNMGDRIIFDGGAFKIDNPYDTHNYKRMFTGTISKISYSFPDTGIPEISLSCFNGLVKDSTLISDDTHIFPSKVLDNKQALQLVGDNETANAIESIDYSWKGASKLTVKDIVENFASKVLFLPIGTMPDGSSGLNIKDNHTYTLAAPSSMYKESPWAYLRKLAAAHKCVCWIEIDDKDKKEKLFFIDQEVATSTLGKISFLYPLRTDEGEFQVKGLEPNQMQIYNVNFDYDNTAAFALTRQYTKYNKEDDDFKGILVVYDPEAKKFFHYELDEKYAKEYSDKNDPSLGQIQDMLYDDRVSFEEILKFYKKSEYVEPPTDNGFLTVNRPLIGLSLKCQCDGNVNIKANANYFIYGLTTKWSSDGSVKTSWRLMSVRHVWGSSGYVCELEFIR